MSADQGAETSPSESKAAEELNGAIDPRSPMAVTIEVYGDDELDEFFDLHDKWVTATDAWTFEEIRHVLWAEAGGYDSPIAGWCRCGDHGDSIESFLQDYGIAFDDEGNLHDLLNEDDPDELSRELDDDSGGEITHKNPASLPNYQQWFRKKTLPAEPLACLFDVVLVILDAVFDSAGLGQCQAALGYLDVSVVGADQVDRPLRVVGKVWMPAQYFIRLRQVPAEGPWLVDDAGYPAGCIFVLVFFLVVIFLLVVIGDRFHFGVDCIVHASDLPMAPFRRCVRAYSAPRASAPDGRFLRCSRITAKGTGRQVRPAKTQLTLARAGLQPAASTCPEWHPTGTCSNRNASSA